MPVQRSPSTDVDDVAVRHSLDAVALRDDALEEAPAGHGATAADACEDCACERRVGAVREDVRYCRGRIHDDSACARK